jgi:hypothetical protein
MLVLDIPNLLVSPPGDVRDKLAESPVRITFA